MTQAQHIPATTPQASPGFAMPKKKGGCCGCFLTGCFGFIFVIVVAMVVGYFALRDNPGILLSDTVVQWGYTNYARPEIEKLLPATMTPAEKTRALGMGDQSLLDYLALPEQEKAVLRNEAFVAFNHYIMGQVIPHNKIPHLLQFVKKQQAAYERFNATPRITQ